MRVTSPAPARAHVTRRGQFTRQQVKKQTTMQRKLPPGLARAGYDSKPQPSKSLGAGRCVLVVDDDPDLLPLTVYHLAANGYRILTARSAAEGLAIARGAGPDLVIIGAHLPDFSGPELLRRLRLRGPAGAAGAPHEEVAVLLLLAGDGVAREAERLEVLALGADDVLTAPFNVQELVLRAAAILRRVHSAPSGPRSVLMLGGTLLHIDVEARQVMVEDVPVELTRTEFSILQALAEHAGRLRTRAQLNEVLWGAGVNRSERTRAVDIQVSRLRGKLGVAGDLIETVRGEGYRLRKPRLLRGDRDGYELPSRGRAPETPGRK